MTRPPRKSALAAGIIVLCVLTLVITLIVNFFLDLRAAFRHENALEAHNKDVQPMTFENRVISEYIAYTGDNRIAISEGFAHPNYQESPDDGDVRITVTQTYPLAEYWVVDEAAAYFMDEGKARRCLTEGPFPWYRNRDEEGVLRGVWTMHRLHRPYYGLTFYLRREQEGMTHKELIKELDPAKGNFTVTIEELHPAEVRPSEPFTGDML